jgi:hypothetical protein
MSELIGKKGGNLEPGYVWAPYIAICDIVSSTGFSGAKMLSRYKNPKVEKIKKILENIEDFNVTSS